MTPRGRTTVSGLLRRIWSRYRTPITVVFLIAAVGWGVWAVWSQWDAFVKGVGEIGLGRVVASGLVTAAGVVATAVAWWFWLSALGARLPLAAAVRLVLVTQTGKYIPGGVWPYLAQAAVGRAYGVAPVIFPVATMLWVLCHLVTGATLGGLAVMAAGYPVWGALIAVGGLAGVLLLGLPAVVQRVGRGRFQFTRGATAKAWAGHALIVVAWVCYGFGITLLVQGVGTELSLARGTGAFAAAWVAGFLVIPAPAGAGVREAVLMLLFDLPSGQALAVVLVSRILTVFADLGLAGLAGLLIPGPAPAREQT